MKASIITQKKEALNTSCQDRSQKEVPKNVFNSSTSDCDINNSDEFRSMAKTHQQESHDINPWMILITRKPMKFDTGANMIPLGSGSKLQNTKSLQVQKSDQVPAQKNRGLHCQ